MRIPILLLTLGFVGLVLTRCSKEQPYGIAKRVPWTGSKIQGTPDPPKPYRAERVFASLGFNEPLVLQSAVDSDLLFVTERFGKIYSFPNDPKVDKAELLIDVARETYGMTCHPQFATNGYFFVASIVEPEAPRAMRVSRFALSQHSPPRAELSSETVFVEWPSEGNVVHNGSCLVFGPDGYLYISTGDSSPIADGRETGQDPSDLPASILRVDVDRPEAGKPYGIPADNPFVAVDGARGEVWAYGLRNPWRMSFDRATGELWCGDIGQDLWEMVHLIERGGNYGWSVNEASHPFRPQRKRGPTPILPPIVEYDHTQGRSVTGGFVYRGTRLGEIVGAYLFGDYDTGRIWGLRYDGKEVTWHEELADTSLRVVCFAEDRVGEIYFLDHIGGGIHRLVAAPKAEQVAAFPRKLSETGLFSSLKDLKPAPGVLPYSTIAPMWSDGARSSFFMALPGESRIEFDGIKYPQPAPGAPDGWKFPDGTVLVQTLSLELEKGKPASRRRLETRILHHERLAGSEAFGDQVWHGYTYIWNDEETDADLLEGIRGQDRAYTLRDPDAPGGTRQQTWHFPSRAECTTCHNMAAKFVISLNTLQMNKDHDYGGIVANQLRTFEHLGLFSEPLPVRPENLPRLADYADPGVGLHRRARSYLHANCAHCHRKWGGGNAAFRLLYPLKLAETGTLGVSPGIGVFRIADARIVSPGDPYRSMMVYRMAKLGSGRMPRLGSTVVDSSGLKLIHEWIASLPPEADRATGASLNRARGEAAVAVERLRKLGEVSGDEGALQIDKILETTAGALQLLWAIQEESWPESIRKVVIARANTRDAAPEVRDLFERFLPEEDRPRRLGTAMDPSEILALGGSPARGERIFFETEGVQCKTCHRIQGRGVDLGPDLSQVGEKYDPKKILEVILEPSKEIEAKYLTYLVQTRTGLIYTGLLVEKGKEEVVLKEAENKVFRLPASDVTALLPQQQSLMPELLLRDMTARQVADLIAYLNSLK